MFRKLDKIEEQQFRNWARENFDPTTDQPDPLWHPVVRDECSRMLAEQAASDVAAELGLS